MRIVSTNQHLQRKKLSYLLESIGVHSKNGNQYPKHKRLLLLSAVLTLGFTVAVPGYTFAAETTQSVSDLQAENAKLRQELDAAKQQLNLNVPSSDKASSNNTAEPATADSSKPEQLQAKPEDSNVLGSVVVTSRNREEIAQDVPIPISIIGGKQIDRDRLLTVDDLTRKAPGLTATTPNARRSGISIRGIGKSTGNENAEAAVGIVVDDVYLSQSGMSYQDYTDLDRIEVLRGPQGTLKGKNTTLGLINYVSRAPSFTPQGSIELEVGGSQGSYSSPGGAKAKASYTNAIIDDVLAWRGSFFVDKQDGDIENINAEGGRWHEKNRYGGRVQFLWKAAENITAKLNLDAAFARENSNTKPNIFDPATFANGTARTTTFTTRISRPYFDGGNYQQIIGKGNLDKLDLNAAKPLETNNRGISAIVDWNLGPVTLTSISAARRYHFDAKNDAEQTRFDIARGGTLVDAKQISQEFRLTSEIGDFYDYQTGLYFLKAEADTTSRNLYGEDAGAFYASNSQFGTLFASAPGRELLRQSLNNVYATNTQYSKTDSKAWFGQINWHLTEQATLTTGLRYTHEKRENSIIKQNTLVDGSALTALGDASVLPPAATAGDLAQAIREGQIGSSYGLRDGELTENSISWLLSPSYKLNENVLLYASAGGGEKSSAVAFRTNNGQPLTVNPEKSLDFELGFKSLLLNRRLLLNVNLYNTIVKDYQATTSTFVGISAGNPTGYQSNFGNIPEITARGLELEGAFTATSNLTLNFGGAYNHAVYSDWKNATCPTEIVPSIANPTCDNTGKQIVGAPKLTGIFGADYRYPLANGFTAHAFFSTVVRSKQNLEAQLSEYGEVSGYSVTDGGIGIISGKKDKFEINLVGKNIFDKRYTTSVNNFSNSAPVGWDGLGAFRYVGLVFRTNY